MNDYAETLRKHRRLAILRHLESCADYTSNGSILGDVLTGLGIPSSRSQVLGELAWLRENGFVSFDDHADFIVVDPVKRLRHFFASEAEANRSAAADLKRAQREAMSMSVSLARFNPAAFAGGTAIVSGLKTGLDGEWYIKRVTHRLPPLVTELELKSSPDAHGNPQ